MKPYHFVIAYLMIFTSLYASTEVVDYRGNNLYFGNFGEKNEEVQKRLTAVKSSSFSLDLSDNYLDDSCIETLLSTLSSERAIEHLVILDLTNNRITQKGLLMLAPLLIRDEFRWLVAPVNDFGIEGIRALFSDLETFANKKSEEVGMDRETLLDTWLSKVIWVPETFDFDRLPLTPSSKEAHKQYYKK